MIIRVAGCKDISFEQEIMKAANFFSKELLTKKMLPHIELDIIMKAKIPDLGNCLVTYYNDWYKPREFQIELRKYRSLKNTLICLAHEMVHLKQFAKCEINVGLTKWKGKPYDTEENEYHMYPWEVEASSKEQLLYAMYMEKI